VSELFGNSVRHSRSGAPGQTITVTVTTGDGVVRVEVIDRSGPGCRSCLLLAAMPKAAAGFS
jgi:anti-sigma regulatory factor (Ser/Thr protein kinase)